MTLIVSAPGIPANRAPAGLRRAYALRGFYRDEFSATGGWPHRPPVREARRVVFRLREDAAGDCQRLLAFGFWLETRPRT